MHMHIYIWIFCLYSWAHLFLFFLLYVLKVFKHFCYCRIYDRHYVCWKCHWSHRYMCKCTYTQARSETDLRTSAKMQGRLNGVTAIFEVLKVCSRTSPYIIFIFPLLSNLVLLLLHRLIDIPLVFSHISKAMFPFPCSTSMNYWQQKRATTQRRDLLA